MDKVAFALKNTVVTDARRLSTTPSKRAFVKKNPQKKYSRNLLISGIAFVSAGIIYNTKKVEKPALPKKVINVFLIGPGLVGGELLKQINHGFSSDKPVEVRVAGLADSRLMHFDPKGIVLTNWKDQLTQSKTTMSMHAFINQIVDLKLPNSVLVDCTSNQSVADAYKSILQARISIVTPNKKAYSGSFSTYSEMNTLAEQNRVKLLFDATVGAGLPFIHTIQSMKRAGDTIVKVEGVLSGTLSYLFNTFNGSVPFSNLVLDAQKQGFTEPDPRDDLNAMDMARKFLILARESGLKLEMKDVEIQRFLSDDSFAAASVSEFYQKLASCDEQLSVLAQQAKTNGQVLRFIGTLENGRVSLSLKAVGPDHPFYQLSGTDNIVSITTRYYSKNPVVIKGPGAGASVTAASVLSNIVQAASDD